MIFAVYLPLFYMAVFIVALMLSVVVDHWRTALYLTLLYMLGRIDSIWFDPATHMLADLAIFSLILLSCRKLDGMILAIITLIMTMSNGIFLILDGPEILRLSVINLLFLVQCLIGIKVSYNAHKGSGNSKGNNGFFLAKVHNADH